MRLGFTGSQQTGAWTQFVAFTRAVAAIAPTYFIHGDCIGWDAAAAHHVARMSNVTIMKFPSNIVHKTANAPGIIAAPPADPLDRNSDIVKNSWALLACPKEKTEEMRSGTWATVRRARKWQMPIVFVYPDGSFGFERIVAISRGDVRVDLPARLATLR